MKILDRKKFIQEAGVPITNIRDFSLYDRAPYECVCGSSHLFSQFSNQAFVSTGGSAKFMVPCPDNKNAATLIKTTNKFFIFFDKFISLAGHIEGHQ